MTKKIFIKALLVCAFLVFSVSSVFSQTIHKLADFEEMVGFNMLNLASHVDTKLICKSNRFYMQVQQWEYPLVVELNPKFGDEGDAGNFEYIATEPASGQVMHFNSNKLDEAMFTGYVYIEAADAEKFLEKNLFLCLPSPNNKLEYIKASINDVIDGKTFTVQENDKYILLLHAKTIKSGNLQQRYNETYAIKKSKGYESILANNIVNVPISDDKQLLQIIACLKSQYELFYDKDSNKLTIK